MRSIKNGLATNGLATLLVVSLASVAYARVPARDAAPSPGALMAGYEAAFAAPQDRPKQEEPKAPRETQEAKPPRAERQDAAPKQHEKADKRDKEQTKQEQKEQKQAGGKNARIPEHDFKAHFGQQHKFAVRQVVTTTRIIPNQTRFVYSGYTFMFVDPWPAEWAMTDDCYIDYLDGEYFMLDPMHPGMQVALSVAF